jgi:hypothetical protein
MAWALVLVAAAAVVAWLLFRLAFVPWGTRWGSTPAERDAPMPGDSWARAAAPAGASFLRMTRAISLPVPPDAAWPWLAQLGRGAGFYSYDRLDNGGKRSACHVVPWIPPPRLGDATAIGYLRHLVPGRETAWWMPEMRWFGCRVTMACAYRLAAEGGGSRLVMRVNGGAAGPTVGLVYGLFILMDSLMARRQLLGIRERLEGGAPPAAATTAAHDDGDRAAHQLYEAVLADGTRAGVPGREQAALWHEAAARELGPAFGAER